MVDFAEITAQRAKYKAFCTTKIGAAYLKNQNATIAYWKQDSDERCSDKRLRELDEKCRAANEEFLALLMEAFPHAQ